MNHDLDSLANLPRRDAVRLSIGAVCAAALSSCASFQGGRVSPPYRTVAEEEILRAAQAIVALDVHGTFVTVDGEGMPRARTMSVNLLEDPMTFWMCTRPGSRKLEQLSGNRRAALHFADTEQWGYASFMGEATVHEDEATVRAQSFFYEELREQLFPEFPRDMVMVEFRPGVLEVAGRGVEIEPSTWQPQGIVVR